MNKKLYTILGISFLLLIWFILANSISSNVAFPSIRDTIKALLELIKTKSTYIAIFYTLLRLIIAIVISFVLGITLASLSYIFPKFASFITPLITIMKTTPVAAIIIILLLLIGENSSLVITSFMVLPLIYEGSLTSFKNISPSITDEVKMQTRINPYVIMKVYLPISLPYIISALISSIGLGLKVMVMSEFIIQPKNSIGYMLFQERWTLEMPKVFAWTIILIAIIMIIDALIKQSKKLQNIN